MSTATDKTQKLTARLTVASGPDRGKTLQVVEELVHVGRGAENHLPLTDPSVTEHQLSIVFRGGRYAVYTPHEKTVDVDDSPIPHARWIWLPATARIRISERTVLLFSEAPTAAAQPGSPKAAPREPATDSVTLDPPTRKTEKSDKAEKADKAEPKAAPAKKKSKREPAVAKFITDRSGEALVRLGEDGHLPELNLSEASERASVRSKPKETSPLLVYGLVAFSFLMSIVLLLVDTESTGVGTQTRGEAIQKIRQFYATEGQPILPWQQWLRDAQLAASRKDRAAERSAYRRVLNQLNSEDNKGFTGLTGDADRDKELRELIGVLLAE